MNNHEYHEEVLARISAMQNNLLAIPPTHTRADWNLETVEYLVGKHHGFQMSPWPLFPVWMPPGTHSLELAVRLVQMLRQPEFQNKRVLLVTDDLASAKQCFDILYPATGAQIGELSSDFTTVHICDRARLNAQLKRGNVLGTEELVIVSHSKDLDTIGKLTRNCQLAGVAPVLAHYAVTEDAGRAYLCGIDLVRRHLIGLSRTIKQILYPCTIGLSPEQHDAQQEDMLREGLQVLHCQRNHEGQTVPPLMLVVTRDTTHSEQVSALLKRLGAEHGFPECDLRVVDVLGSGAEQELTRIMQGVRHGSEGYSPCWAIVCAHGVPTNVSSCCVGVAVALRAFSFDIWLHCLQNLALVDSPKSLEHWKHLVAIHSRLR